MQYSSGMGTPLPWSKNTPFQSFLLIALFSFFAAHFLLLSPSSLEDDFSGVRILHPKELLNFLRNESETALSEPFMATMPPQYSVRDSTLFSTRSGSPAFQLRSRKANAYPSQNQVHLLEVDVLMPDQTRITSEEALYDTAAGKIVFHGSVRATLPDGAEIRSRIAYADTTPLLRIRIPLEERVDGSIPHDSTPVRFTGFGMEYADTGRREIVLLSSVVVDALGKQPARIRSDRAAFSRQNHELLFFMDKQRPVPEQFVTVAEKDLDLKSRLLEMKLAPGRSVHRITATGDVWFLDRHQGEDRPTEGTGGKAVYDVKENRIILSEFPQLYQDHDTVTGDVITYHRDTDIVEVTEGNAVYQQQESESGTR